MPTLECMIPKKENVMLFMRSIIMSIYECKSKILIYDYPLKNKILRKNLNLFYFLYW